MEEAVDEGQIMDGLDGSSSGHSDEDVKAPIDEKSNPF